MQYHSLEVVSPLWIVAAHKAASQGNAFQLSAPDGMRGSWAVRSYPLADGGVGAHVNAHPAHSRALHSGF